MDDDKPDFVLSVAKNRFALFEGIGLYQHNEARLLCNSRRVNTSPFIYRRRTTCQSERQQSGEFSQKVIHKPLVCLSEPDARDYAKRRYDFDIDGVPFVSR